MTDSNMVSLLVDSYDTALALAWLPGKPKTPIQYSDYTPLVSGTIISVPTTFTIGTWKVGATDQIPKTLWTIYGPAAVAKPAGISIAGIYSTMNGSGKYMLPPGFTVKGL